MISNKPWLKIRSSWTRRLVLPCPIGAVGLSLLLLLLMPHDMLAQSITKQNSDDRSPGAWVAFRKVIYRDKPLLLHLRRGHERAVLMPEAIAILDEEQTPPGCVIAIDNDVIGFFAMNNFDRVPIRFVGKESGSVYELLVRASPDGILQTLQITR